MTLLQYALANNEQRCFCGTPLTFSRGEHVTCYCPRCEQRSRRSGDAIHVIGHGSSVTAAYDDWLRGQESF